MKPRRLAAWAVLGVLGVGYLWLILCDMPDSLIFAAPLVVGAGLWAIGEVYS